MAQNSRLKLLLVPFSLLSAAGLVQAEDPAGLPHAFDAGWKGQQVCEVLFENDAMVVGKCTFPPGVGHEKHYHNPHFGYIIEGTTYRVTDISGVEDIVVESGATWSTDTINVHDAVNVGKATSNVIIVETKP